MPVFLVTDGCVSCEGRPRSLGGTPVSAAPLVTRCQLHQAQITRGTTGNYLDHEVYWLRTKIKILYVFSSQSTKVFCNSHITLLHY